MYLISGMYSLPSHLSQSARDLILRLLVVDPMKRITIPGTYEEIRESLTKVEIMISTIMVASFEMLKC